MENIAVARWQLAKKRSTGQNADVTSKIEGLEVSDVQMSILGLQDVRK